MGQSQTRAKRAASGPEHDNRDARPALSELITLQLRTEMRDLNLENLLLAIYFVRIGTLLDRDYDRYCESEHGISGGDMGVLFALRRSGPPWLHVERRPFASRSLTCGSRGRPFTTPVQAGSV